MSIILTIQTVAAVYLLFLATAMTTRNLRSALFFQFIPSILAAGLGFFSLAQLMGWPV